ncbi:MAG: hypothetical protein IMZ64_12955 [Bacteroidetes bacterium]|nr:hypothetical protein [Bacteroidota bacterium]
MLGESDFDEDLGECDNCNKTFTVEQIIKEKDREIAYMKLCLKKDLEGEAKYRKEIAELKAEIERLKPYEKHVLERKKWAEDFHKKYD